MSRIYVITDTHQQPIKHRLVRASNQAQARNFAARDQFAVDVAGQQTLVDLLAEGVKVEEAGEAA
jgi:hypothetical protein